METVEQRQARTAALEARRANGRVEDRALTRDTLPASFFAGTASGVVISERGALAVADALACVRVLSDTAASLPCHVYRRGAAGRTRAGDTLAARLLERPAPAVTQANLIGQLVAHLALYGEAFLAISARAFGSPRSRPSSSNWG